MAVEQKKQQVANLFNSIANVYDCSATRFFPFCGDMLVSFVKPKPGTKVLDIAAGTGAATVPMAQAVGAQGRVVAIDLSSGMLDKAEVNVSKMALNNVDYHEMDGENLDFKSQYFHSVVCSYGLFFIPDMQAALKEWTRVVKPGGKVGFTCFETSAFEPMVSDFIERVKAAGVDVPTKGFGSYRIESVDHCHQLLGDAGLENTEVNIVQLGYHLKDEKDWWEVVTNTAMRQLLQMVPEEKQADLQVSHLDAVRSFMTDEGLWMDVKTRFASGVRPAE